MTLKITRRAALAAAAVTPFAITRGRAADTVKIGVCSPLTGPAAEIGAIQLNSLKLSAKQVNDKGGILGKQIELVIEDDQTTNPGIVLAFSRLAANPDIAAFVGSIRSTQVNAMAPDAEKVAKPVMFGGTDPTLTHNGYKWLFRCRPNDSFSARVVSDFTVNTLQKKKVALICSSDAFGTGGQNAMIDALAKLGLKPALVQPYANQQADFTPVVLAIRQSDADALVTYFTFEPDLGVFARQVRQLGVRIPWVGSPSIASPVTRGLAKNALYGTYGIADFFPDQNDESRAFSVAFAKAYNGGVPDSGWTYDAMQILAMAMNAAKTTDPQKVRAAIIAIKGYKGTEGTYNYDENGDGLRGYSIIRNENGDLKFEKHIEFES
ncbi:MAG TPA: ABC transporter substrate-binding protein [Acetobacteraceae bacterium]|jgi:branched-chain amino acid transport system substrate-binding protein|nr:ABC transporter substrate-binding protein [Acetobacteraceae bacterium]